MRKRKAYTYRKPKRRRKGAKDSDAKARSLQSSWRKYTATTLPLDDARKIVASPPSCIYCNLPIDWHYLSIDHLIPQSREGPGHADNLALVHSECNRVKGDLTKDEFLALLDFLKDWPIMKNSVWNRLRIAGALYGRSKRRGR